MVVKVFCGRIGINMDTSISAASDATLAEMVMWKVVT